jgi:hypothetical protein
LGVTRSFFGQRVSVMYGGSIEICSSLRLLLGSFPMLARINFVKASCKAFLLRYKIASYGGESSCSESKVISCQGNAGGYDYVQGTDRLRRVCGSKW